MTTSPGAQVKFRDDFASHLTGVLFEINPDLPVDFSPEGRPFVGIRVKVRGRWNCCIAWVSDLRSADGLPLVMLTNGRNELFEDLGRHTDTSIKVRRLGTVAPIMSAGRSRLVNLDGAP